MQLSKFLSPPSYFFVIIWSIFFMTSFTSCISSGKVIDAQALGVGNSNIQIQLEPALINQKSPTDFSPGAMSLSTTFSHGLSKSYDAGVSINVTGFIGFYNKFQLVDRKNFDFAIGLDGNASLIGGNQFVSSTLYFSYTIRDKRRIMINPSIIFTNYRNAANYFPAYNLTFARQTIGSRFALGYTTGFNYTNEYNFIHELSIVYNIPFIRKPKNSVQRNN